MKPFIDQTPERIWLHGVGDTAGETTWAADPNPSGDPMEAEHAIAYVRSDVVAARQEQWRHLLTSMLEHCRTAGLDMVSTLYKASGNAIAAMEAEAAVVTPKIDDLRIRLQERIRDGQCADDTEDGDVNFCGSCDWCLLVTCETALSAAKKTPERTRTTAGSIRLEMAAASDEAEAREGDWQSVVAGTATPKQYRDAIAYAVRCAGWTVADTEIEAVIRERDATETPARLRAAAIAAYAGPVVSFDVGENSHLASCDGCGWVGSSEECGTDRDRDDSDVYCPRCHASGADHGTVASKVDVGTS